MDNCYMWVCLFLCMFLPLSQEQCFSNTKSSKLLNTLWTAGYDGQFRAPEGLKVRQFSNTEVKVAMQQSMASPISRGVCDGNVHNVVPLTYRVVHDGHGNNKRCIQMYEEENLILYQEVAVASDDARVSDCPDKIAEDNKLGNGLSKIGVPYSNGFDFSGATCGNLPRRVFHATVNQAPGGECGDQSSKVEITDTEVIMDTCASGNSYDSPFSKGVRLRCVAQLSPTLLGNGQEQGTMYILGYENVHASNYAGTYSFFCVFAFEDHDPNDPKILMSFDSAQRDDPACRHVVSANRGYNQVGKNDKGFGNYKHMILRPNDCPTACMNGGTCRQKMRSFECICPDGWTDPICSTSIDDCASSPCQHGGTCVDQHRSYRCACTMYYDGVLCENPICLIPPEMAGTWYGAVEMEIPDIKEYLFKVTPLDDDILYYNSTGALAYTFGAECAAASFGPNWNTVYFTRTKASDSSSEKLCYSVKIPGWSTTSPFWWYKAGTAVSLTGPCSLAPDNLIYVMTKQSHTSTFNSFGSVIGTYEGLEYRTGIAATFNCPIGTDKSTGSISRSNAVTMKSCSGSGLVNTNAPYGHQDNQATWTVIGEYTSHDLWGTGYARYLFLEHEEVNQRHLVCTRFMDTPQTAFANGRTVYFIEFTMHTAGNTPNDNNDDGNPYQAICKNYHLPGSASTTDDLIIKLISDRCSTVTCHNEGTCINSWQDFRCHCKEGWSGRYCELEIDDCGLINPCLNGGTCIDLHMDYRCDCRRGYYGARCQYYDDCGNNPCIHGNCTDYNDRILNTIQCSCDYGYRGSRCEIDYNECASNPCKNGGVCYDSTTNATSIVQVPLGLFECVCPAGYEGIYCETDINDCARFHWPCKNGGTCLDRLEWYYCRCTPQWIGVHCEHYNECWNITCLNGGVCLDDWKFGSCKCPQGYGGKYCEHVDVSCQRSGCLNGGECRQVGGGGYACMCATEEHHGPMCQWTNMCWGVNPCQNNGRCVQIENSYACACPDPWTGDLCTLNKYQIYTGIIPTTAKPRAPLDTVTTIIITVAVVVAVAIIIVVIFFMVKHYFAANAAAADAEGVGAAGARHPGHIATWQPDYKHTLTLRDA